MADAKEAVGRLGALKQSFAWGAVQLFSPTGQPIIPLNQHLKLTNVSATLIGYTKPFLFIVWLY